MNETGPPDPPSGEDQKKRLAEEQAKRRSPSQFTNPERQGSLKPQSENLNTEREETKMDEKAKGEIAVGSKVRLRDGRVGKVTELRGDQVVVTAEDGTTTEAPATEAEPVDTGTEGETAA